MIISLSNFTFRLSVCNRVHPQTQQSPVASVHVTRLTQTPPGPSSPVIINLITPEQGEAVHCGVCIIISYSCIIVNYLLYMQYI